MSTDSKRDAIIEAAFKRFAHFGVPKTTMNEISDDLNISKASLYYYFPDKLNLFAAVLQKILENAALQKQIEEKDPFKAMDIYLERRTEFMLKNQNILEYLKSILANVPKELKPLFEKARKMEYSSIEQIITKGYEQKLFVYNNPSQSSKMLSEALTGMRHIIQMDAVDFFPDRKKLQALLQNEKLFATIFLKGLTVK